jgi:hypothetical protein
VIAVVRFQRHLDAEVQSDEFFGGVKWVSIYVLRIDRERFTAEFDKKLSLPAGHVKGPTQSILR